jgi:hypothetical protein
VFRIIAESDAEEADLMEGLRREHDATDADLGIVRHAVKREAEEDWRGR